MEISTWPARLIPPIRNDAAGLLGPLENCQPASNAVVPRPAINPDPG